MPETAYAQSRYKHPEIEHRYGPNVHLLDDPVAWTLLARLFARAGTMPSQIVYDLLNEVLDPDGVRQDHLFMSRMTDERGRVTGTSWHDAKIGRDVDGRIVLF